GPGPDDSEQWDPGRADWEAVPEGCVDGRPEPGRSAPGQLQDLRRGVTPSVGSSHNPVRAGLCRVIGNRPKASSKRTNPMQESGTMKSAAMPRTTQRRQRTTWSAYLYLLPSLV